MFSFRSLYMVYDAETTTDDIPTYQFITPWDAYDSTLAENAGFRYKNTEQVCVSDVILYVCFDIGELLSRLAELW